MRTRTTHDLIPYDSTFYAVDFHDAPNTSIPHINCRAKHCSCCVPLRSCHV